jgi:hypothetical protein
LLILEQIFPGSSVFVGSVNGREVIDYWKSSGRGSNGF